MINGKNVRPQRWSNVIDLYDDGEYSFIYGNFDSNPKATLGIRWNGGPNDSNDVGYPSQGQHPTWFVLPEFLTNFVLSVLLQSSSSNTANIKQALRDFNQ